MSNTATQQTEQTAARDTARYVITNAVWRLDSHDMNTDDSAQAADAIMDALEAAGLVIVAVDRFERLRQEAEWMQIAHDDGGGWGDSILHPGDLDPLTTRTEGE